MTSIPKTMKAWVQNESHWLDIREVPVFQPKDNQVLVKVLYVAQNPTDWKHSAFWSSPDVINGCDFAGTVVALGPNLASPLKLGDRVAGSLHGGCYKDEGSHAEYTLADSDMTWLVPEGMGLPEASTFGVAWLTAAQAMVQHQGKAFPTLGDTNVTGNPWASAHSFYIVYGGSSSVGLFAIQLGKFLGYKILAIASPHSFSLVKSYGADAVLDYHNPDEAIAEALKITDGGVELALDTISEGDSFRITVEMMGKKGKQFNALLPIPDNIQELNPELKTEFTGMSTLLGKEFEFLALAPGQTFYPAVPEDRRFGVEIFQQTPVLISKYGLKPNPVQITGGFEDVTKGLELLKNGKISGKKSVIRIAEE
ncbi:hypothetical protein B9479_004580 [Cryptococcus floricola]|uniref:Enoyl reductase (ER) domain-containing protein n=1 Tax=Cryptococcus floricola TaxID=2591691 RepID=A0A5D3AV46_9TREE|nr:hypothetical protein B9479_004580 [Cryptococcus floricola]